MNARAIIALTTLLLVAASGRAHDTWVQTNTQIVRLNDAIHIDLLLGNHGNEHRDFRMAGKLKLEGATLSVIAPDGKAADLKSQLTDQGLSENEGFWTTRFRPNQTGLYTVLHTSDTVVSYAPKRSIKSGKTYFVSSVSLDKVPVVNPGFEKPAGHALELVPLTNPVTPMGPGEVLKVQLLYKGKPLAGARVSFIPRGVRLSESFDERYERKTDEKGVVSFEFRDANYYLIAAHHEDASDKGQGYDSTKYSATMTVYVPATCPCCD